MLGLNAEVSIREGAEKKRKQVVIGDKSKPVVHSKMLDNWQSLLDVAARIVHVPSALIMQLHESEIEVFLGNHDKDSPYKPGARETLGHGLYCETVIGKQQELLVPDATKVKAWSQGNPDIPLGMISYLGLPLNWPDQEVFGTVCLLDNKENHYSPLYSEFLHSLKQHIEDDLKRLVLEQQLKDANRELIQLNKQKTRFLSIISHDIRSGLGAVDQTLQLLVDEFDALNQDRVKSLLDSLRQNAGSTYMTLVDLLFWSKTDMLELEPAKKTLNAVSLIRHVMDFFRQGILQKKLRVETEFAAERVELLADENMLKAILRNLVSNAIKHSRPGGRILLGARLQEGEPVIEVRDFGTGMDPVMLEGLFSKPGSTDAGTDIEEHAGIGLLIAKDFLDMHGARVEVESKPHEGTTFRLFF